MNESNAPLFSELLDWLEGRLPPDKARDVAERLQTADAATQETYEPEPSGPDPPAPAPSTPPAPVATHHDARPIHKKATPFWRGLQFLPAIRQDVLQNRPSWKSTNACMISCLVFITNGP